MSLTLQRMLPGGHDAAVAPWREAFPDLPLAAPGEGGAAPMPPDACAFPPRLTGGNGSLGGRWQLVARP